jgi:hypothetical protein
MSMVRLKDWPSDDVLRNLTCHVEPAIRSMACRVVQGQTRLALLDDLRHLTKDPSAVYPYYRTDPDAATRGQTVGKAACLALEALEAHKALEPDDAGSV